MEHAQDSMGLRSIAESCQSVQIVAYKAAQYLGLGITSQHQER